MTIEERLAEAEERYQRLRAEYRQRRAVDHVEQRKLYDDAYGVRIER